MTMSDTACTKTQSAQTRKSNVPEFSVGDLAFSLKQTLEDNFGRVRVRGELSRVSIAGSGHMYSSLKDHQAVMDAVCWKGVLSKLSIKPEEGLEVICTGKITTYPKSSKYQLVIESMELAGEGALLKMLEERRKSLAAEGLFSEEKKKPLPFLPKTIGVVTSPSGAVIRDILHRLSDRFPRNVLLWPVLVQGEGAADQISAAIRGFETLAEKGLTKPDLLIIARGGGSLEDLMAFNEENVVRAIADSTIPVISAIGHETDTTLADFAADLRAPTPTGAAEIAVPVRANLIAQILEDEQRLVAGINRLLSENRQKTETLNARLGDPSRLLETHLQRLDHTGEKLANVFTRYLDVKRLPLIESSAKIKHPKERIADAQRNLERWSEQLGSVQRKITYDHEQKLNYLAKMLEAYSFENVLKRGFSVIRNSDGKIVSSASNIKNSDILDIQFQNNEHVQVMATSSGTLKSSPPKKQKKSSANTDENQQDLFGG